MKDHLRRTDRNRLVKSELYLQLAVSAERWATYLDEPATPIEDWPEDDPLRSILDRYEITPDELAHLIRKVATSLETKCVNLGFDGVPA